MLRQLLLVAILVTLASACGPRQTSASTPAQPSTTIVAETPSTTIKNILTTETVAESTSTIGQPITDPVTDALSTTIKDIPTTETSTDPQPTTTKAVPTAETITDAPSTTTDTTTKTVTVPTSTKAQPTPDAVTEASTTTVKVIPTTETSTVSQPTSTTFLPTTNTSTTSTATTTEGTTTEPEPPRTCAKNGDIKAIFILVDGSGTFSDSWGKVLPFIRLFKEHVSRQIPIWFYQWSSLLTECRWSTFYSRRVSWLCYGDSITPGLNRDPCQGYNETNARCPAKQFLQLPPNWTDQDFDSAAEQIYKLNQRGWTRNWLFMNEAVEEWRRAKKELKLASDARALLIQLTDGQSEPTEVDTVKAFREENMKFYGVQIYDSQFSMRPYTPVMEDVRKDFTVVTNPATQLNGELVQRIVTSGCTPAEKTPPRCAANGTMKGVFLMIDGSATGHVNDSWSRVQPFVKLFKKYVDREIPIWLMQTSSSYECNLDIYPQCWYYCGKSGKRSWECTGDADPCPASVPLNTTRCPKKNLARVSPNWNDDEFDTVSEEIYGILQGGWTTPWWSFIGVGNTWNKERTQLGFDKDAPALVVYVGTGHYMDQPDRVRQAQTAFKTANVKFLGVEKTPMTFEGKEKPMTAFNSLMKNAGEAIIETAADGSGLDEHLVQQIVRYGCN